MPDSSKDAALKAVRTLCARWPEMSREDYRAVLAADCVYVNMPRLAQRRIGPDAAFEALEPWRTRCDVGLDILHIGGDASVVFCERLERFAFRSDGRVIELYVTGVFELRDGLIVHWRDYFESAHAPSAALQPHDTASAAPDGQTSLS